MRPALAALALPLLVATPARADRGELLQTDNLGMNLWSHDFSTGKTATVADSQVLSEFVGLHYFVTQRVRVGMNFQLSERLDTPPPTGSRFATFALLPQVGVKLVGPLFAAGVFTIAPRFGGTNDLVLGVQLVVGASWKVANHVALGVAVEVPYNFYPKQTLGLTPLAGAAFPF